MTLTEYLESIDACEPALTWLQTQPDSAAAYRDCEELDWITWLLSKLEIDIPATIDAEYDAKRAAIWAEYDAKYAAIWAEYDAKRAPIRDEYDAKCAAIRAEYDAKRETIDAEYYAKLETIRDEYDAKHAAIRDEYNAKRAAINAEYLNAIRSAIPWSVVRDVLIARGVEL